MYEQFKSLCADREVVFYVEISNSVISLKYEEDSDVYRSWRIGSEYITIYQEYMIRSWYAVKTKEALVIALGEL